MNNINFTSTKKILPLFVAIIISAIFLSNCVPIEEPNPAPPTEPRAQAPEPRPVPDPAPSNYVQNRFCNSGYYNPARRNNTINSYRKFLNKCTNKTSSWHQSATLHLKALLKKQNSGGSKVYKGGDELLEGELRIEGGDELLDELQKQKQKEPEPKPEPESTFVSVSPKVEALNQIPGTNIITPKKEEVITTTKKTKAIIIDTGSLGKISKVRKIILEKTLESKLDAYFAIVTKDMFDEAKEEAFQELEDDECTEDQCVMKIQEILQVENAFKMQLIMEGQDTQISITWNSQEEKRVEEDFCEGCKTKDLRKMISVLVEGLVGGNN